MASLKLTDALRAEYQDLFSTCTISPDKQPQVEALITSLVANKHLYDLAGTQLGIPWHFVAVVHNMESSQSFKGHLHNGDPLTARTVQIPAGRPKTGSPPFTWQASAQDALTMHGLHKWTDWSVAGTLYQLELYNGIGYRLYHPHVKSPYLWSFSNHYKKGKYVADGTWSDEAVSKQCGAAVLLRRMIEKKLIAFSDQPLPPADAAPLVVPYSASKPTQADVLARATILQKWLTTFTGIYLKPDGWPGKGTSDAYKIATGSYLPGDPRLASSPDRPHIDKLIQLGGSAEGLKAARLKAAAALPGYPTNGCAVHLSALLDGAGINVPMTWGAGKLAHLIADRGWSRIAVGSQQPGDIGVCYDNDPTPVGADHIYLVIEALDKNRMMIADNQRTADKTHDRYASGHGKTPTEYFLRA